MTIKLVVKRQPSFATGTLGALYVNGEFFCYTMEDPVRPAGVYVKDETAIPAGTYPVTLVKSPRFGYLTPRLGGKLAARGILLHKGNGPEDSRGCILVGMSKMPNNQRIYNCPPAFEGLMHRLLDAPSITLTIQ